MLGGFASFGNHYDLEEQMFGVNEQIPRRQKRIRGRRSGGHALSLLVGQFETRYEMLKRAPQVFACTIALVIGLIIGTTLVGAFTTRTAFLNGRSITSYTPEQIERLAASTPFDVSMVTSIHVGGWRDRLEGGSGDAVFYSLVLLPGIALMLMCHWGLRRLRRSSQNSN